MAEELIVAGVKEGEAAIDGFLANSARLTATLNTAFAPTSLEAIHGEFAKALPATSSSDADVNAKLVKLSTMVREEAAAAASAFRAAEMWIRLKAPSVSDGNNFGVDVQNYVLGEIHAMRSAVEAMTVAGRDYHWSRAEGLNKMLCEAKVDKTESASKKTEDGKAKEEATTSSSKTTEAAKPGQADYKEYVVGIDVRQYQASHNNLVDLKNYYLRAHVLFVKNMKRLSDPRGEGEDGRSANVMTMF